MASTGSIVAMETPITIRNRNLNSLEKPHVTIINKLSNTNSYFLNTRIDISDKTKINTHSQYKPDDSTIMIHPDQDVRFSLRKNKTLEPEHNRLGMNDAEDAALISIYIYGAHNNPLHHLVIGKGSLIPFGDTITITANPDGAIVFTNTVLTNNGSTCDWTTHITSDPEEKQLVPIVGIPDPGYIRFQDIDPRKIDIVRSILKINYYFGRQLLVEEFLRENLYIRKLINNPDDPEDDDMDELLEELFTMGLLRSPEKTGVEEILKHRADRFDRYLQEDPDFKNELASIYPLDDDLDEQ